MKQCCKNCTYLYRTASQYSNRWLCLKRNFFQRQPKNHSCPEFEPKKENEKQEFMDMNIGKPNE